MVFFQIGDLHIETPALKSSFPFLFVQSPTLTHRAGKKKQKKKISPKNTVIMARVSQRSRGWFTLMCFPRH